MTEEEKSNSIPKVWMREGFVWDSSPSNQVLPLMSSIHDICIMKSTSIEFKQIKHVIK